MKKALITLGLVGSLLGSALAMPVSIDDSGLDYYNSEKGDSKDVYVDLSYEDGTLKINFLDEPGAQPALKIKDVTGLPLAEPEDEDDAPSLGQLRDHLPVERRLSGIGIVYNGAAYKTVMDAYDALFASLGFTRTVDTTIGGPNTKAVFYTNGDDGVRVRFSRRGGETIVRTSSM